MASSSSPPRLAPVREFAPIDMNIQQDTTEEVTSKPQDVKLRADTLESGAPETAVEASLGQPSPKSQPAVDKQSLAKAIEKSSTKLTEIPEEASHLETRVHRASNDEPTKNSISTKAQHLAALNETAIEEKDDAGDSDAIPPAIQSKLDKEKNFQDAVDLIKPKLDNAPESVTKEDADLLLSREMRAHGSVEKGGITAQVQSIATKNEEVTDTA